MNLLKRAISLCLLAAVTLSCAACGLISVIQVDGVPEDERVSNGTAEKTEHSAEPYVPTDGGISDRERARADLALLGEYDFGGETVFIAVPEEAGLFPEESAAVLDRLTVQRNALVEEALCVKLVPSKKSSHEIYEWAKREKKAGEVITDILLIPSDCMAKFASEKTLADLSAVTNFSTEYPFIDGASAVGSSITDAAYGVSGHASYSPEEYTAVLFNKTLLSEAGVSCGEVYSCVKDGDWTWDRLLSYAAAVDGAAVATPNSQPALIDILFKSSGGEYLNKDVSLPTVAFTAESLAPVYSIFSQLNSAGIKTSSYTAASDFIGGETSFLIHRLSALGGIAGSSVDFGILPLPKASADGEYRSAAPKNAMMFAVPKEAENKEKSYAVILAMNAATAGIVYGGYVSDVFAEYLRDEQSADMLDLILSSAETDPAYLLGALYPEVANATYNFVFRYKDADEKTAAKQLAAAAEQMKKALEKSKKAIDKIK